MVKVAIASYLTLKLTSKLTLKLTCVVKYWEVPLVTSNYIVKYAKIDVSPNLERLACTLYYQGVLYVCAYMSNPHPVKPRHSRTAYCFSSSRAHSGQECICLSPNQDKCQRYMCLCMCPSSKVHDTCLCVYDLERRTTKTTRLSPGLKTAVAGRGARRRPWKETSTRRD